jgi:hypothetical protein
MKPYRVLRHFAGNQTGNGETEYFKEGTTAMLSDHLAEVVLKAGHVEPAEPKKASEPALTPALAPAEDRETKVTGPEETKPEEPKAKKGKK